MRGPLQSLSDSAWASPVPTLGCPLGQLAWAAAALPAGLSAAGLACAAPEGALLLLGLATALTLGVGNACRDPWGAWLLGCQVALNVGVALATVHVPPYILAVDGGTRAAACFRGSLLLSSPPPLVAAARRQPARPLCRRTSPSPRPPPTPGALALPPALPALRAPTPACRPWLYRPPRGRRRPGHRSAHPAHPTAPSAFWAVEVCRCNGEGAPSRTFYNVYLDTTLHAAALLCAAA